MQSRIDEVKGEALAAISAAKTSQELNEVRVRFLCKSGEFTSLMKLLGTVSKEELPEAGRILN